MTGIHSGTAGAPVFDRIYIRQPVNGNYLPDAPTSPRFSSPLGDLFFQRDTTLFTVGKAGKNRVA